HTRSDRDWSSDVCSSDLSVPGLAPGVGVFRTGGRSTMRVCGAGVRPLLAGADMAAEVHPTATVYDGTVLGEGVKVLENAVVGKRSEERRVGEEWRARQGG